MDTGPLSSAFLHIEDGVTHMHIASCAIFEGRSPVRGLRRPRGRKLPLLPRYRQKVRFVPGQLGRPVWVDDPHFNLAYHVRHSALPPPGRRGGAQQPDGPADGRGARSASPAVGGVDDRGAHRWPVGPDLQGPPLHGRRHLGHRSDGGPARPDPPALSPLRASVGAATGAERVRSPSTACSSCCARQPSSSAPPAPCARPTKALDAICNTLNGVVSLGRRLQPTSTLSIEGAIGPHRRWSVAAPTSTS